MKSKFFGALLLCLFFFTQNSFAKEPVQGSIQGFDWVTTPEFSSFFDGHDQGKQGETILVRQAFAKIVSDPEGGRIHNLVLELDQSNKIVNLNRETEGEGGGRQVVTMKDLMKKPAVLARTADRDILILSCMNCSAERGGTFKLKYLYNGMTMKYKSIELAFSVASNSRRWQLHAKNHKKKFVVVEWLRLVPRMIFGQLVGIKKILVNE